MKPLPSAQHGGDLAARVVFFVECGINILAISQCFFFPRVYLAAAIPASKTSRSSVNAGQQVKPLHDSSDNIINPVFIAFVQWYGVLLTVLTYIFLRALISFQNVALAFALEAMALGDVLQIIACFLIAQAVGGWTPANISGAVLSIFYLGWRIYFLALHYRYDVPGKGLDWYPDKSS